MDERTPTPVRVFGVRLHSMGLSVREAVVVFEVIGIDRSHGGIWNWAHTLSEAQSDPPTVAPSRVAVDEKQIEVDGEKKWLYAAIDIEPKLLLEIDVFSRRGTDPAAAFLYRLTENHETDETEFLVDAGGYPTALARHELSGQLDYSDRNHIEKRFQTVSIRIDRFHSFWRGSPASARRWLRRFRHHYNHDRPNQALNGRTPAEEVLNKTVPFCMRSQFQFVRSSTPRPFDTSRRQSCTPLRDILKQVDSKDWEHEVEMNDLSDPRPPLPEWILDAYDLLCTHSLSSAEHEDVQSIPREQALEVLCSTDELVLEPEAANHALTRLLERGYFYEVDGELRVTTPEE